MGLKHYNETTALTFKAGPPNSKLSDTGEKKKRQRSTDFQFISISLFN